MNLKQCINLSVITLGLISFVGCSNSNESVEIEGKENAKVEQNSENKENIPDTKTPIEKDETHQEENKTTKNTVDNKANDNLSGTTENIEEEKPESFLTEEESLEKLKDVMNGFININQLQIGNGKSGMNKVVRVNNEDFYAFYEVAKPTEEIGFIGEDRYLVGTKTGTMYAERNINMGTYIPIDDFIANELSNR